MMLRSIVYGLILFIGFPSLARSQSFMFQPNSNVGLRVLLIDYGAVNGLSDKLRTNGLEIKYIRELSPRFAVAVPLKVGVAHMADDLYNRSFVSADALLHYHFNNLIDKLVPDALGGVGMMREDTPAGRVQLPVGAGANFRVGDFSFVNVQAEFRVSPEKQRHSLQLGFGFIYRFKKYDSDNDGVGDLIDECPDKPGLRAFKGCPDTDGDWIPDPKDNCPTEAGTRRTRGCPDRDKDGVPDYEDVCPDVPGYREYKGCPQG